MYNEIYVINPFKYPEDWYLACGETQEEVIAQFCKDNNLEMTIDEFYEKYRIDTVNCLGSRRIKSIELEIKERIGEKEIKMSDLERMKQMYDDFKISYEINLYGKLSSTYQSLFLHYTNISFDFDEDGKFLGTDICS